MFRYCFRPGEKGLRRCAAEEMGKSLLGSIRLEGGDVTIT